MFEQSILVGQPAKKTWTLAISLVAQTSFVLIVSLIPLIYTDKLPGLTKWTQNLAAPSPPPAAPPAIETRAVSRPVRESPVFAVPPRIPRTVAVVNDDLSQRIDAASDGVVGSLGPPTMTGAVTQLFTSILPAPRPPEPPLTVRPPESTREPLKVSQGVQEAKLLRKVIPLYPPLAITTRTQGTVHLIGVIGRDGSIRDLQVIDGHPLLVRAALDAVKQWIYKPTLLNGTPVEVVSPIVVTFTLNR
jgi:periplasmic protein TonB